MLTMMMMMMMTTRTRGATPCLVHSSTTTTPLVVYFNNYLASFHSQPSNPNKTGNTQPPNFEDALKVFDEMLQR
ncbi:hypothetical protein M0R45_017006 [Rubus argutus]